MFPGNFINAGRERNLTDTITSPDQRSQGLELGESGVKVQNDPQNSSQVSVRLFQISVPQHYPMFSGKPWKQFESLLVS